MHPLCGDLTVFTDEELHKKASDLAKRLQQAYRMGMGDAVQQIQMLIFDYQSEIQRRNEKAMKELEEKSPEFKNIIDIN